MVFIRKKYDQSYFDNFFIRNVPNSQRNRKRLEEVLDHKQSGRLLEIGFGDGEFLREAQMYFDVEGMDVSHYAVRTIGSDLKEKVKRVDIEDQQSLRGRYDVIVGFNILEHLKRPGIALTTISESLREGGFFLGSVPFNAGVFGKLHTALTNFFDKTHVSTYPPQRWLALLEKAGFRKVQVYGETLIGGMRAFYFKEKYSKPLWFNMMLLCEM
jgi:SAM-dependent methyltransferase